MVIPSLTYTNLTHILPQGNIFALESRSLATSKTELDIYGNQINVLPELTSSEDFWSIGAAYVDKTVVDACQTAYAAHTELVLVTEEGTSIQCQIAEYPQIDRHKVVGGNVLYTIKLTLRRQDTSWTIPVISMSGPRLFGR